MMLSHLPVQSLLVITIHSPEAHYVCGTAGYEIMVSPGTRAWTEKHFWHVKLPPLWVCLLVVSH